MSKDRDVIRAFGYMVIQASHLEAEIERLCQWISMTQERPKHHESHRISDKIKWCKSQIEELEAENLDDLDKSLDRARNFLEKRNELVHGRIYFAEGAPEKFAPSKEGRKEKVLTAEKMYELADKISHLHLSILSSNAFRLVAAMKERMDA